MRNFSLDISIYKLCDSPKVVVTFYLRLRNEFQPFPAKNQASDWLTQQFNQLEAWFLAGNFDSLCTDLLLVGWDESNFVVEFAAATTSEDNDE